MHRQVSHAMKPSSTRQTALCNSKGDDSMVGLVPKAAVMLTQHRCATAYYYKVATRSLGP